MTEKSEVYIWLKSSSPSMKLERLSLEFENRGFLSRRSLAYVKSEDLDSFFPSPDKLLLAERRLLQAELKNIKTETACWPNHLEPKRLNMTACESGLERSVDTTPQQQSPQAATNFGFEAVATPSNQSSKTFQSPLDQRALELSENLKLLELQVESAKNHIQGKQKALEDFPKVSRGKVCAVCYSSGHNRAKCTQMPCNDVNVCKIKEKHPELLAEIRTLQRELKELEQKYAKVKSDHEVFISSCQRAKSSFFAIMGPRLRKQNAATYLDRSALDRDLMIIQRALRNKVPLEETYNWRLPSIIEEYKHGIVDPLRVQ